MMFIQLFMRTNFTERFYKGIARQSSCDDSRRPKRASRRAFFGKYCACVANDRDDAGLRAYGSERYGVLLRASDRGR